MGKEKIVQVDWDKQDRLYILHTDKILVIILIYSVSRKRLYIGCSEFAFVGHLVVGYEVCVEIYYFVYITNILFGSRPN